MATLPISSAPVRLTDLPRNRGGEVARVDWHTLSEPEAKRLRELGLDEGVAVSLVHRSGVLGGPVAARLGRMTVALRRHVAAAIHVTTDGG